MQGCNQPLNARAVVQNIPGDHYPDGISEGEQYNTDEKGFIKGSGQEEKVIISV